MLIITDSFWRREFKSLRRYYSIEDIKRVIKKRGKQASVSPSLGYKYGHLVKFRITNPVAGRLVVYVFVQKNQFVPIVLRLKKDKVIGENLSMQNKQAKKLILERLDGVMEDIKQGMYKKYEL